MSALEPDLNCLRPLVQIIENTRVKEEVLREHMGGYLLGVAVGYMQAAGATDDEMRKAFEDTLKP